MYETKVVIYDSEKKMDRGIKRMEKKGWVVTDTEITDEGYGCFQTGCLALIFLPLALLGKKPNRYKVTFSR